ncbi:MAG: hypothetical protein ACO4AJ_07365, partial [Prochlorothrix sp.]
DKSGAWPETRRETSGGYTGTRINEPIDTLAAAIAIAQWARPSLGGFLLHESRFTGKPAGKFRSHDIPATQSEFDCCGSRK